MVTLATNAGSKMQKREFTSKTLRRIMDPGMKN